MEPKEKSGDAVGGENAGDGIGHGDNASTGIVRGESGFSRLFDRVKGGVEKEKKDEAEKLDGISKDDGASAEASIIEDVEGDM